MPGIEGSSGVAKAFGATAAVAVATGGLGSPLLLGSLLVQGLGILAGSLFAKDPPLTPEQEFFNFRVSDAKKRADKVRVARGLKRGLLPRREQRTPTGPTQGQTDYTNRQDITQPSVNTGPNPFENSGG